MDSTKPRYSVKQFSLGETLDKWPDFPRKVSSRWRFGGEMLVVS
jgi:hypothetical protein